MSKPSYDPTWNTEDILEIAQRQKHIIWILLLSIIASFIPYATLITGIILFYFILKMGRAIRISNGWLYCVAIIFPLIGPFALLVINSNGWLYCVAIIFPLIGPFALLVINRKATKILTDHGLKVGFLGVRSNDINKLASRMHHLRWPQTIDANNSESKPDTAKVPNENHNALRVDPLDPDHSLSNHGRDQTKSMMSRNDFSFHKMVVTVIILSLLIGLAIIIMSYLGNPIPSSRKIETAGSRQVQVDLDSSKTSDTKSPSLKRTVAWKLDSDIYLDIVRCGKKYYSNSLNNTDDPLTTIRLLLLLQPLTHGSSGTTLQVTVLAYELMNNQSNEGEDDGSILKKGLEGQMFRVELTPGFRQLKLTHTDRMLKNLQIAFFGDELPKQNKEDIAEIEELAINLFNENLIDALIPIPISGLKATDNWSRSLEYSHSAGVLTTINRNYLLKSNHTLNGSDHDVISWKGSSTIRMLAAPKIQLKNIRLLNNGLDEGTVLWCYPLGHPVQINSIQRYEIEGMIEINGKDEKIIVNGLNSCYIRFTATNPDLMRALPATR